MTPKQVRKLIGKRVRWEVIIDRNRGSFRIYEGVLTDVNGRNALVDGEWKWIPDMTGLSEVVT